MQEIRKMYQRLGPVLLLFVGLLLLYREPLTTGLVRMPVDEVDSRFNHYLLEHSYRWLVNHQWLQRQRTDGVGAVVFRDGMR